MPSVKLIAIAAALLAIGTTVAYADPISPDAIIIRGSGTDVPLLAGMNFVIGFFEALVLYRLYRVDLLRLSVLMVLANEVSMTVGWLVLVGVTGRDIVLQSPFEFGPFVLISFLLAVLLEWPFVWWAMLGRNDLRRLSFTGSVIAQAASYSAILAFCAARWVWIATSN